MLVQYTTQVLGTQSRDRRKLIHHVAGLYYSACPHTKYGIWQLYLFSNMTVAGWKSVTSDSTSYAFHSQAI